MKYAKSNAELVEEVVKIADLFNRDVATPDDTRKMLGLKGFDKVNY
jgi:3-keto-5-aminohexanoate cleavage enzyme